MFLLQQTTHRMVVRHHPEIGHLYLPNLKARLPSENGGYYVTTNTQGFRSDVEFVNERRGRPRIGSRTQYQLVGLWRSPRCSA